MNAEFKDKFNAKLAEKNMSALTDAEIESINRFTEELGAVECTEEDFWKMYMTKLVADRDLVFVDSVNEQLVADGYAALTNEEVGPLLAYRDEFRSHHDWVWDTCTEPEFYSKWMELTYRRPSDVENKIEFKLKTPEGRARDGGWRTLTAYSGADALMVINGQVVGEAQEINWRHFLKRPYPEGYPVHGKLTLAVFNKDPIKELLKRERTTMGIIFANEYGQMSYTHIEKPEFVMMEGGISIDDIIQHQTYYWFAEDVVMMEHDGPIHLENGDLNPVFDN